MMPLRIVQPPPEVSAPPVQRCFDFLPLTVVVIPWKPRTKKAECKAPPPTPKTVRPPHQQLPLAPRIRPPIRSVELRAYSPRKGLEGARPRSMGTDKLTIKARAELRQDMESLAADGFYELRPDGTYKWGPLAPQTYGDCPDGPCPWASCRHNLMLDVDPIDHVVKEMFPGRDFDEIPETCSLRASERPSEEVQCKALPGAEHFGLKEVGEYMNLTMEAARLGEVSAKEGLKRGLARLGRRVMPTSGWTATEDDDE